MDFVICTMIWSHDIAFSFDLCKHKPKTFNKYAQPLNHIHLRAAQTQESCGCSYRSLDERDGQGNTR